MNSALKSIGGLLMGIGFVVGGITWIATTAIFFSDGNNFLGLVSLLIPPSEVVLPWVISPTLGFASLTSTGCLIIGAVCSGKSE
jgi:hypothetical protein